MAEAAPSPGPSLDPVKRRLWLLGSGSLLLYVAVAVLSCQFGYQAEAPPVLAVLALLATATVGYWLALRDVLGSPGEGTDRGRLRVILLFAVAYRLVLLPSLPILEIDYYRYLWDGRVTLHGLNPYHYSPFQIQDQGPRAQSGSELANLWQLAQQSEAVQTGFERIHFAGVPTAYPPFAQVVFALAALLTPAGAPLWAHVPLLKTLLLVFDLATLAVLALLLRRLRFPVSWCLAYGWCPLVLKEFANSAHLDTIAVFLTTLAVYLLVRMAENVAGERRRPFILAAAAMLVLSLAVLAKSYPIILLPVVGAYLLSRLRLRAVFPLILFVGVLAAGYLPFCNSAGPPRSPTPPAAEESDEELPPASNPGTGLGTFLTQWEMNDFLFMLVYENLRRPQDQAERWFVRVPERWRDVLHRVITVRLRDALHLPPQANPALVLTQMVMGALLLALCLRWAWTVFWRPTPELLLRGVFLSLAWGWLLSSTQNPWYLLWSLPFMLFAGRRSWFLLPGLVLLYYVRLWMELPPAQPVERFDYGIVWLEYLPFFLALMIEACWFRRQSLASQPRRPWRAKVWWGLTGTAALLVLGTVLVYWNRPRILVGGPSAGVARVSLAEVDHEPFDRLLRKYVDDQGLVAYARWKADAADLQALDDYLASLGAVDRALPASKPAQLAYWINAYNALTIKGVLRVYPTKSILDLNPEFGFKLWRDLLLQVDDEQRSLDDIEHKILRKMGEPRIHFALVCAARGCPPLWNRAYRADRLEEELAANGRCFFARPAAFQADGERREVKLSQLLDWYGIDFADRQVELLKMLRPYFPSPGKLSWITEADVVVEFQPYDWSLNDQAPRGD